MVNSLHILTVFTTFCILLFNVVFLSSDNLIPIKFSVSFSPEYKKITVLNTKKMFLHWNKNEKDNFYHDVRAIYNTSGKTNNSFENIFVNDTDINDMMMRINSNR